MNAQLVEVEDVIASLPYEEQQIIRAAQEEAAALEVERMAKLRSLVQRLGKKCDEAILAKRPIEDSMIRALQVIEGIDNIRDTKVNFSTPGVGRAPPSPKLVRTRVQRWEARLNEMLVPVQQDAWDLAPDGEPVPQIDPETQVTEELEVAKARVDSKALAMKDRVREDLAVCNFSRSARRMNRDASRIGTGLLMGPMTTLVQKRRFDQGMMTLDIEESMRPEIREADPRFFFPDPVPRADRAEYAFYAFLMGELEVRNLANNPGFDEKQIAKLLKNPPQLGELKVNLAKWNNDLESPQSFAGKYAVWRYTGVLNKEDLKALGLCGCDGAEPDDDSMIPEMAMAELWYSGECILMAKLSPIENDYRIPYFVFAPFQRDDTMFGIPLAEMCEGSNRSAVAAWRMVLINGSVSSAPTIIRRKGAVEPADKQHQQVGPKLWDVTDPAVDINNVMTVVNIPNTVEQALAIFDRSIALIDEELNTAQWGDASTNEEIQTASGLAMTLNVRSIIQANVAAAADDEVFKPAIERMVWWNNIYSDDETIKGDYIVMPLIQSVRLVKDTQAQHLQVLMGMAQADPEIALMVDKYDMVINYTKLIDIPPTAYFLDKQAFLAKQAELQQQADPNTALIEAKTANEQANAALKQAQAENIGMKSQMDQMMAQMKDALAQAQVARDEMRLQLDAQKQQQSAIEHEQTMELRWKESQDRLDIAELRETGQNLRNEHQQMINAQLQANQQDIDRAAIDADLTKAGMDTQVVAQEIAVKQQFGTGI